jgi:aspartate/methionine/tyrosine aminotransferase
MTADLLTSVRPEALAAPESGIVEVMNYGLGRPGLIPLWAGEGDLPTPDFICAAAQASLDAGETGYTWQRGIPELRKALAAYHARLYDRPFDPERFFVTNSGMHAIQLALRMLVGPGDEVIVPTPAWPNFAGAAGLTGARVVEAPLHFGNDGWTLPIERLERAVTPASKVIFVNSPANPTGWTASADDLAAILALARRHGLWIVADEVYGRFVYDGGRAASFHDVAAADDRIVYVNTFSKNWAMTGWRLGWIETDPALGQVLENLVQYSNSGVPVFVQRAGVVALAEGDDFIAFQRERMAASRALLCDALARTGRVRLAPPKGAFYLFFGIDGETDTARLGLRLVDEANIGLAPGDAFGRAGRGFLRFCFARGPESVAEATRRLVEWLEKRPETVAS